MSDTTEILSDEFKIAYPLTYDAIYQKGREDAKSELCEYCDNEKRDARVREDERAKIIELYTEYCRIHHSNFDEEYAEDIQSDFEEWLKRR